MGQREYDLWSSKVLHDFYGKVSLNRSTFICNPLTRTPSPATVSSVIQSAASCASMGSVTFCKKGLELYAIYADALWGQTFSQPLACLRQMTIPR